MTHGLRLFEGDDDHVDPAPHICRLDDLVVGETYTFDPPLHVATVMMLSDTPTKQGLRKPNFMRDDIRAQGLRKGKLVNKIETSEPRIGTFMCEARFHNTFTNSMETMRYAIGCQFSRQQVVNGTVVNVRRAIDETVRGETSDGETA